MAGAEGGAVIHVESSRQASFEQGLCEGIKVAIELLAGIELAVGNEAAHIVAAGKEIGFTFLLPLSDLRAVHGIRLPDIVRELGLEAPSIHGAGSLNVHESLAVKEAVDGGWFEHAPGGECSELHLGDQGGDGSMGELPAEANERLGGLLVDHPA